jgi:hypothetical protein
VSYGSSGIISLALSGASRRPQPSPLVGKKSEGGVDAADLPEAAMDRSRWRHTADRLDFSQQISIASGAHIFDEGMSGEGAGYSAASGTAESS